MSSGVTRVQWLTKDAVKVYDVFQEKGGTTTSWKYLDSRPLYSHIAVNNLGGVRNKVITPILPYTCNLLECENLITTHSLHCLVSRIVHLSPGKIHIEKIMSQLSKLSDFYYKMPAWELDRKIRAAVQTDDKDAVVKLKGDFCYSALEYNDDNSLEPQDLSFKSSFKDIQEPTSCNEEVNLVTSVKQNVEEVSKETGSEIPSKITIRQMIVNCLKKSEKESMSTSEISSELGRENPSIKHWMVYENLKLDPRVKKCENETKQGSYCWKLTNAKKASKSRSNFWLSKIMVVLKGKCLATQEICDLLKNAFPEVMESPKWKNRVYMSLYSSKSVTKKEVSPGFVCWSIA